MGLFSGKKDERLAEEKAAGRMQHKAYRDAGNQAARAHRDQHMVHDQINEAVIESERDVPWWRR